MGGSGGLRGSTVSADVLVWVQTVQPVPPCGPVSYSTFTCLLRVAERLRHRPSSVAISTRGGVWATQAARASRIEAGLSS